jgi:hypothetical protein
MTETTYYDSIDDYFCKFEWSESIQIEIKSPKPEQQRIVYPLIPALYDDFLIHEKVKHEGKEYYHIDFGESKFGHMSFILTDHLYDIVWTVMDIDHKDGKWLGNLWSLTYTTQAEAEKALKEINADEKLR